MQRGQTALHAASQQGIMDSVRILLRLKANVNAADEVRFQKLFSELQLYSGNVLFFDEQSGHNVNLVFYRRMDAHPYIWPFRRVEYKWQSCCCSPKLTPTKQTRWTTLFATSVTQSPYGRMAMHAHVGRHVC